MSTLLNNPVDLTPPRALAPLRTLTRIENPLDLTSHRALAPPRALTRGWEHWAGALSPHPHPIRRFHHLCGRGPLPRRKELRV